MQKVKCNETRKVKRVGFCHLCDTLFYMYIKMKHQWPQFDPPASMVCVCAQECHVTAAKMIYFTTPKVNVARISPHRYDKKKHF